MPAGNSRKLVGNSQALEERHIATEFDKQVDIALRPLITPRKTPEQPCLDNSRFFESREKGVRDHI